MHENSKLIFAKYARRFFSSNSRILEIGPDVFPSSYTKIIGDEAITWDTLDIANSEMLTYPKAGEYFFPVSDDLYDVLVCQVK
jgi:hypothetical protein